VVPSPNPLVAARHDSTDVWDGFGLAEDIRDLAHGISAGNWVDLAIGGFAASMDALAFVTDPLGSLASWGVAWLIEHVKPLSDALDWLAGDPDQIAAFAQTWRNVAGAASSAAAALRDAVARDLAAWSGAAADAYRQHAASQASALGATSDAAGTIALITEASGLVVALVRNLVRDLIAEFVSILAVRLWEWLAEEACTLGIATPWVAAQVSALVGKWVAKIAKLLKGLASTVKRLAREASDLGQFIERVRELLKRTGKAADDVTHGRTGGDGGSPNVPGTHGTSDGPTLAGAPESPPRQPSTDAGPTGHAIAPSDPAPGSPGVPGRAPEEPPPRSVAGPAGRGPIREPHSRHNLNQIGRSSRVKESNTVVLPGTDVAGDLDAIRWREATWDGTRGRYLVNGRSYGVEHSGTVFPDSGPGLIKLSRGAYKVLKQFIVSDGDIGAAEDVLKFDPNLTAADRQNALEVFRHHRKYRGEP
jgi:hypothetical protein